MQETTCFLFLITHIATDGVLEKKGKKKNFKNCGLVGDRVGGVLKNLF